MPLPAARLATITGLSQYQEHRLRCQRLSIKECVYIQSGLLPTQNLPTRRHTCDRTPSPEPKRDRRQSLAGDISKYEPGTKSQVPRPPLPWEPQPGFLRLREGEGWGQAGSGGSRGRQPPAPDTPPEPLPGLPASLGKRKDYLAPRKSNKFPEILGRVDRKATASSNVHGLKIYKWNIFPSPLLNPLKPGMLVKNSLAVHGSCKIQRWQEN